MSNGKSGKKKQSAASGFMSRARIYLLLVLIVALGILLHDTFSGSSAFLRNYIGNTTVPPSSILPQPKESPTIGASEFTILIEGTSYIVADKPVPLSECVELARKSGLPITIAIDETSMTGAEDELVKALEAAGLKVSKREVLE
ncbi:MAG: hypothetical protein Kow00107_04900 [Planctomycetota bacterium]